MSEQNGDERQGKKASRNFIILSICTALILFLIYSVAYLNQTGLNYDETFFVNAALGGLTPDFIYKKIFDVPVMIFPYAGALKSYLYFPIFKLFGVNVYSIRIPAILLAALTLLFWYKNAAYIFKNTAFLLFFIFIASTDPAYIIQSRFDFGPVVLQNLLVALSFYLYFRMIHDRRMLYPALLAAAMTLGLYNKLNFIWFVSAFVAAALTFYPGKIYSLCRRHAFAAICIIILFSVIIAAAIILLILPSLINVNLGFLMLAPLYSKCIYMLHLYLDTMNGAERYFFIFLDPLPAPTLVNYIEIAVFLCWLITFILSFVLRTGNRHYRRYNRLLLFFLLMFVLEFIQIVVTPQARNSEHLMILWPMHHLLFLLALASVYSLISRYRFSYALFLLPLSLAASQLYTDQLYLSAFKNPYAYKNQMWTPAVYLLSNYINHHINEYDAVISIDFGPNNQVFALANNNHDRMKFHEIYYLLTDYPPIIQYRNYVYPMFRNSDSANEEWLYTNYFKGKNNLIIMYHDKESIPGITEKFYAFAIKYDIKLNFVTTIQDAANRSMYTLLSASD